MKTLLYPLIAGTLLGCQTLSLSTLSDASKQLDLSEVREHLRADVITTSFADADPAAGLAACFGTDQVYLPLGVMPRSAAGGYLLTPGFYEMTVRSYCIRSCRRDCNWYRPAC
ncbi:hypothetical protein [Neolewinella sp.]|uniref:hypothetical protein n=1 Tax=Neolewinella sp. TaxID=2993543 RepID=UPI003B52381F